MDRGTRIFWALIALLFGTSLFFGASARERQRVLRESDELSIASGDLVTVVRVIDGDSVVVRGESGAKATVRLLGIETFEGTQKGDDASRFAVLAAGELERLLGSDPVRVAVHSPAHDRHGRTLAHLYAGEIDVGLELVRRGLAVTYAVYPFESLPLYASEQARAEGEHRGLWAEPLAAERARRLEQRSRREKP